MEAMLNGEISCKRVAPNFGLRKFIESTLSHWITSHPELESQRNLFYSVTFDPSEGESTPDSVDCQIKVVGKSQMWLGENRGRRTRDAFALSLKQMKKIHDAS